VTELRSSRQIQGNILAPFPDEAQAFLCLHFGVPGAAAGARAFLGELLAVLTTLADLLQAPPRVCCGVGLTSSGLAHLAPEWTRGLEASFPAFHEGPARRAPKLRDHGPSLPETWRFGGPRQPAVDALVTLAATEPEALDREAAHWRRRAETNGLAVVYDQRAARLPGEMAGCEHFGFKDALSQPAVRGFDPPAGGAPRTGMPSGPPSLPAGEFLLGHGRLATDGGEDPPAPCAGWMRDGSFQVLRRLTQDVPGWRAQIARLAASHRIAPDLLAAKLIGRWPSGTPLSVAPDQDAGSPPEVEFDFNDDPFGRQTPLFAHIRKMYPRDDTFFERDWHRILRRAVPFGPVYDPARGADGERGLLFNAFMASIENQFEFLIRGWANDPDFLEGGAGPDPVVGESDMGATLRLPGGCRRRVLFERFVHASGAVYAFVPARSVLEHLAHRA
jgi:Dyp-type peroxidase family